MTTTLDTFIDGGNSISIDIRNRSQQIVGPGPILSCLSFTCDSLLSQAGSFSARFPANDPLVSTIELKKHFLDFYVDGTLIFYGLAEAIRREIGDDGQQFVVITGRDSLGALTEGTIRGLHVGDGGVPIFDAPYQLILLDGASSFGIAGDYTTVTGVYGDFVGEDYLTALTRIAERIGECFRLYGRNSIWWMNDFEATSIRAIQGAGDAVAVEDNDTVCLIERLVERRDASRMINQIRPYGSGLGETRLDLAGHGRSLPDGYSYDETENYIRNDAAVSDIGKVLSREVNFKDIRPLFNTDADILSAKNFLFDAALAYLQRNDDVDDVVEYDLDVIKLISNVEPGLQVPIFVPGMSIHVIYQDESYDLDTDLIVLGIRRSIDSAGAIHQSLTVSNINQWRLHETNNQVSQTEEGQIFAGHAQADANSYWKPYKEWIGDDQIDHLAEVPFFLSAEVVTIRQVLFRYKVEQILAAYATYTLANVTSQNIAANTGATAAGSTDTDGGSTTDTSGSGTSGATAAGTTVSGGSGTSFGAAAATTDDASYTGGVAQTNLASPGGTDTPSFDDTAQNTAGTAITIATNNGATVTSGVPVGNTTGVNSVTGDPHTHGMGNHTHDVAQAHTATLPQHTHPPGAHTHNISTTHRHTIPAHTHTSTATHTHTTPDHTHVITATHTHTTPSHSHLTPNHTHVISATHIHSSPQHTHPLPSLVATFALQRIPALSTYVIGELEYSTNGGSWAGLDTGIPVAGGWTEIDVTSVIQNPAGLKRPYQEYNLIQIRRTTAAGTGKSAQIRVEIGIRATVQSIVSYS